MKTPPFRKEVIDWSTFEWAKYKELTGNVLNDLYDNWVSMNNIDVDDMAMQLNNKIHECVESVAVRR